MLQSYIIARIPSANWMLVLQAISYASAGVVCILGTSVQLLPQLVLLAVTPAGALLQK